MQRGLRGRELRMGCAVCNLFSLQTIAPAGPPALPLPAPASRPRLSLRRALPTPSWGMLPNKSLWLLAHAGPCYCPTQMLSACSILHQPEARAPLPGQGYATGRHSLLLVVSSLLTAPLDQPQFSALHVTKPGRQRSQNSGSKLTDCYPPESGTSGTKLAPKALGGNLASQLLQCCQAAASSPIHYSQNSLVVNPGEKQESSMNLFWGLIQTPGWAGRSVH